MHKKPLGLNRWSDLFCQCAEAIIKKGRVNKNALRGRRRRGSYKGSPSASLRAGFRLRCAVCFAGRMSPLRMTELIRGRSRDGAAGGLTGCRFVVRGVEDYAAGEAFALAFRAE